MDDGRVYGSGLTLTAETAARLRREADILAQSEAEIAAGAFIEDEAMAAWLDRLDAAPDAPLPRTSSAS